MAVFRVVDSHIVHEGEFRAQAAELARFRTLRDAGERVEVFGFSDGRSLAGAPPPPPELKPGVPFKPIGKGLPLTILIRDVYTGQHPDNSLFFGDGGDVALVSGVKNYDVFNASTRALNFLVRGQQPRSDMRRPAALADGTAVVAYSPAVMTDSLTVSFELAVATFPVDFVTALSTAFSSAAGMPLLLPYAGYLLGAGQLVKIAGNAGHALFDGIKFQVTDSVDFDLPGSVPAVADFRVLTASSFDPTGWQYRDGQGLFDSSGRKYEEDEPYIVISLDGGERDNLKSFAPTAASAAILQRFFQVQSGAQAAVDTVVQGLQLVADLKYRDQAVALRKKAEAATDPAVKSALQKQLAAALDNISNETLKPAA